MNQTRSIVKHMILFFSILLVLSFLLYYDGTIGLADNSDYARTLDVFSMSKVDPVKYLSFESNYLIQSPKTTYQYFKDLFYPIKNSPQSYYSTQFIFVKLSLIFNSTYNHLLNISPNQYNIFFLSFIYIILYAYILTRILLKKFYTSIIKDFFFKILILPILLCTSYLVYFNSFYGETTTFIFLILIIFIQLDFPNIKPFHLIILLFSIFIFSGSKTANYPSALLFLILAFISIIHLKKKILKVLFIGLLLLCLIASTSYIQKAPEWMEKVTTYHSVFYGILKNTEEKEETLEELNLDAHLIMLHSTHGYMDNPYDIYSDAFEKMFFDHVSKTDVLLYYLKHPPIFLEKLDKSAEAALPIKATYLSNFEYSDGRYLANTTKNINDLTLIFEHKFDHYDDLRKSFTGNASIFFTLIIFSFILLSLLEYKKSKNLYLLTVKIILLCSTLGQFIVPIIGNGEADLAKHMFLYNIHIDIMIIFILYDIVSMQFIIPSTIFIILMTCLFIMPHSVDENIVIIGHHNNRPIEWIVIQSDQNKKVLLSKDILYYDNFSDVNNSYLESSIKNELHSQISFNEKERTQLIKNSNAIILPHYRENLSIKGNRPFYWFPAYKYSEENYDDAYQTTFNDYLSIPSITDIAHLPLEMILLNEPYWLRTPNYSSDKLVRYVEEDGFIYHRHHNNVIGVRPILTIKNED